ncbi:S41 family peptidase [uncultured Massilia sp.]|uniref:S41 family peptidase n=1 Tax=uncultured Massilia sp. TaxID=169973 RepID=UPI00258BE63E|nr:S41 family peptidase [uncultured Massilia sp.]
MVRSILNTFVLAACLLIPPATAADAPIAPEALQADLRFMRAEIERIHPEPGLFVSRETLRLAYERIEERFRQPMERDAAWRTLATLNPLFADAHMFVTQPDWKAAARAHVAGGGVLFPFEVQVGANGDMIIRAELGGGASKLAGMRIARIDGVPTAQVAHELLGLMAGDTPALRANLLSRRMWLYYWKTHGAPAQYAFTLANGRTLRVAGSARLSASVADNEPGFARAFGFELLPGKAALLTVNTFLWPDRQAFYDFTKDVFTKIRDAGVTTLIIDIRENTGGDDDPWKFGILPYVADKPARNGSSYIKKVIAGRASGTEQVGDVVHGFGDAWVAPQLENPLRFTGKTYVLVGRLTYSSAVLFSNVMQDFGFAKLVGAGGYARTRQTGGVVNVKLPNTGLEITIPRFVLDRPSGSREPALVHPDIVLPDSPLDRRQAIDALLARLRP